VAASSTATSYRYPWDPERVRLDLGTHLVAGQAPFELRANRESYRDPIVVSQILRDGGKARTRRLPSELAEDFSGLKDFLHITITDAAGATVLEHDQTVCLNNQASRSRPDAPDTSPYPSGCPRNPFTLGAVWAIQGGWSAATANWSDEGVVIADGEYTAKIEVNERYQRLFGIPDNEETVKLTVRPAPSEGPLAAFPEDRVPQPAAAPPAGAESVPAGPKPDLRSLPAWGIEINPEGPMGPTAADDGKDYLGFNANVWNAGPPRWSSTASAARART
jgi:hypothetical protein